ncbi:MAG: 30S ribosomal protein S4 [Candidatus Hadarchaeum sp.]
MKRQRKKYLRPSHPWEKSRMDAEDAMLTKFGLRRKEEIWRAQTLLRNFRSQARNLLAVSGPQAERETRQLISRLQSLGLVGENATLDDVLGLTVDKILERRLQSIVHKKGLAQSMLQARQLIVHGHIAIAGRCVNVPSYLVPVKEEPLISYTSGKTFAESKLGGPEPSEPVKVAGETVAAPERSEANEPAEEGEN